MESDMTGEIPVTSYAIIIGAMKSGTSSVFNYLKTHPEICPAVVKEPEFFSENQPHGFKTDNFHDLWPAYDPTVHKYVLEASTGYTKYPEEPNVPRKIFESGIRPKFIYIVRNPFDRIVSHYNFVTQKNWKYNTLPAPGLRITDSHFVSLSNYFLQLKQFRRYFPPEQILILDFDELQKDPSCVLQKIYEFLNVTPGYFHEKYEVRNPTKIIGTDLERRLKQSKTGIFLRNLPRPLKKTGIKLFRNLFPPVKRELTDTERACIHNELKENMARFHHMYGFDVRKWGFDMRYEI